MERVNLYSDTETRPRVGRRVRQRLDRLHQGLGAPVGAVLADHHIVPDAPTPVGALWDRAGIERAIGAFGEAAARCES